LERVCGCEVERGDGGDGERGEGEGERGGAGEGGGAAFAERACEQREERAEEGEIDGEWEESHLNFGMRNAYFIRWCWEGISAAAFD